MINKNDCFIFCRQILRVHYIIITFLVDMGNSSHKKLKGAQYKTQGTNSTNEQEELSLSIKVAKQQIVGAVGKII